MFNRIVTFYKILRVTRMLPVISSFFISFVVTSILLVFVEPQISNLEDSMWYLFASFTTIGYGDFAAQTTIGRLLTAFLSLNGILVVALIPAVAITFVSETYKRNKNDIDTDPLLLDKMEHLHKLSNEELKQLSKFFKHHREKALKKTTKENHEHSEDKL